MTPKPKHPLRKISAKKLASLGGKHPFSSIASGAKKPKARNPKRQAKEFARCYGSKARVEFVQSLPCVGCAWCNVHLRRPNDPCENAHVTGGGAGRKADSHFIVPLCSRCHREQHRMGWETFEQVTVLDRYAEAANTEAQWQAHRALSSS